LIIAAHSALRKVLFWHRQSVASVFVYEMSAEPLNGFLSDSDGIHVWSLARTSLKVKGQGHQGQKRRFLALLVAYMRFMFGERSLASSFVYFFGVATVNVFLSVNQGNIAG